MRDQLQDGFVVDPLGLVDVVGRFGEAAQVHDAEERADRRPAEGGRFAVVVEAGPVEAAGHPGTFGHGFPGAAVGGAPAGAVGVVRAEDVAVVVGHVFAAYHQCRTVFGAGQRQGGIRFVEGIVAADLVVEAAHVDGLRYVVFREEASVHGGGHRAGRVESFDHVRHAANHLVAVFGPLHRLFVEDRPQDHARAVAVAAYEPLQLAHVFGRGVEQTVLVEYHDPHAVAGVHELFGRGVVGGAVGVDAHLFQLAEAELPHGVGNGHPYAGMVLVVADPFDLDVLAVQPETGAAVEPDGAEPAAGHLLVGHLAACFDGGAHGVEVRRLGRPEGRIADRNGHPGGRFAQGQYADGLLLRGDGFARGREQGHFDIAVGLLLAGVVERYFDGNLPLGAALIDRVGIDAVRGDVQGRTFDQPGMAVDAGSFVPPPFLGVGVDAHGDGVDVIAVGGVGGDVDVHRGVAAPVAVQHGTVHPDGSVGGDPVELDLEVFALVFGGEFEFAAIPPDAAFVVPLREVGVGIDRAFDGPVVGQIDDPPVGVVVVGGRGAAHTAGFGVAIGGVVAFDDGVGNVAQVETPPFVERKHFAGRIALLGMGPLEGAGKEHGKQHADDFHVC